jgi:hypothetical protein
MLLRLFSSVVAFVVLVAATATVSHVPRQTANITCGSIPYNISLQFVPLPPSNFAPVALDIVNNVLQQVDGTPPIFSLRFCESTYLNVTSPSMGGNSSKYYG